MPCPRIIFFSDFDGTLTGISGNSVAAGGELRAQRQHNFYKSLFKKQSGIFDYATWEMLSPEELQRKLVNQFGKYDPKNIHFDTGMGVILIKPDAMQALHKLLDNKDVELNIVTKNNPEYVKALLKYQGLSDEEINKIKIHAKQGKEQVVDKVLSDHGIIQTANLEHDVDIFVLDDSHDDFNGMINGVRKHELPVENHKIKVHGYNSEVGRFNWQLHSEEALALLGNQRLEVTRSHVAQMKAQIKHSHPEIITSDILKHAIELAKNKYKAYHQSDDKDNFDHNRGIKMGWLSGFSFRHGPKGIEAAEKFDDSMSKEEDKAKLIEGLIAFFADPSKAYHHHSFTSYLADELANIGLINYQALQPYEAKTIVEELQKHLSSLKSEDVDGAGTHEIG